MVKQLKRAVWKRFGSTYGSPKLREARSRLMYQCWLRYQRGQQNGLDPQSALAAALPAPEEVAAARAPHIQKGMAARYYASICVMLIACIPLLYAGVACVRSYIARGGLGFSLAVFAGAAIFVWMIAQGILWLVRSSRRVMACIMILIGVPLLACMVLFVFLFVDTGKLYRYDYTDRIDQIESIDLVRLDENPKRTNEGDCLKYTVMETAAPEQYGPLLKDLAGLRYYFHWFGDPPWLREGSEIILIRFSPDRDGMLYAFYGSWHPGYVRQEGTTQEMTYYLGPCSRDRWDELAERYFPNARLR